MKGRVLVMTVKSVFLMIPVSLVLTVSAGCGQPEPEPVKVRQQTNVRTSMADLFPEEAPVPVPVKAEPVEEYNQEAAYIAKTVWGEARGCSVEEQEQVIWCILNRVDSELPYFPDDIISVITQPNQFHGYSPDHPVTTEHYELALDVLARWEAEKRGEESNRNLPPEYVYFHGDGEHNYFRIEF